VARKDDVTYTARPELRQPVMVIALDGWVDGGQAATGTLSFLRRKLRPRKLAEIHPGRFYVYQVPGQLSLRPHCRIENGLLTEYRRQHNVFYYWINSEAGQDVILFQGAEPNLNWDDYCAAVLRVAGEFGVSRIYMLGGVLDKVPHTREPAVSSVCTGRELRDELLHYGVGFTDYEGPGGVRTALLDHCRRRGVDMAMLHVRATYYPEFNMVIAHNPKAIRALVILLQKMLHLPLDISELDRKSRDFEAHLSYLALQNSELKAYVEALERDYRQSDTPEVQDWLSADEAIQAAEEFLRGYFEER